MVTQKAGIISEQQLKVAEKAKGRLSKGKPVNVKITVDNLVLMMDFKRKFCRYYKMKDASFEVLIHVYAVWVRFGKGVGLNSLCLAINGDSSGSLLIMMAEKRDLLLKKGLIEYLGRNRRGGLVYAPTVRAIDELGMLGKLLAVETLGSVSDNR